MSASAFQSPTAQIPWGPAFLAPIAGRVRRETGQFLSPRLGGWIIQSRPTAQFSDEQLDLVMVGRAHLANPHWPYQAARALGIERPHGFSRHLTHIGSVGGSSAGPTARCTQRIKKGKAISWPNRVAGGFSPPAPTPPTVRVRSGRFNELARSTK